MIEVICGYLFVFIGVAVLLLPIATGIEWLGVRFLDVASEGMIKFKGYLSYFDHEKDREYYVIAEYNKRDYTTYEYGNIDTLLSTGDRSKIREIAAEAPKVSVLQKTIFSDMVAGCTAAYTMLYFTCMLMAFMPNRGSGMSPIDFATGYLTGLMKIGSYCTPLIVPLIMLAALFLGIRYACRTTKAIEKKAIEVVKETVKAHEDTHHTKGDDNDA